MGSDRREPHSHQANRKLSVSETSPHLVRGRRAAPVPPGGGTVGAEPCPRSVLKGHRGRRPRQVARVRRGGSRAVPGSVQSPPRPRRPAGWGARRGGSGSQARGSRRRRRDAGAGSRQRRPGQPRRPSVPPSGECVRRCGVKWPNLWDLFVFERFGVSVPMAWGRSQRPANPGSPAAPPEPRGLLGGPSRLGVERPVAQAPRSQIQGPGPAAD
ncbi:Rab11-Binding Protein Relch [Manis pentadactyla]|nr:Rab11-Binding Protein Relch [Manis pentadactyla]